jgi:hypothetical protein
MLFDREGFYPDHNCKRCNQPLSRTDRPAELYAGSYTGLCYKCQNAPMIVLAVSKLDGCKRVEHAPDCPSHSRERRTFHAYDNCPACKGTGRTYVSRSLAYGGSYYTSCDACFKRYYNQERRQQHNTYDSAASKDIRQRWLKAAEAEAKKLMPKAALYYRGKGELRRLIYDSVKYPEAKPTWDEVNQRFYPLLVAELALQDQYTAVVFDDVVNEWTRLVSWD